MSLWYIPRLCPQNLSFGLHLGSIFRTQSEIYSNNNKKKNNLWLGDIRTLQLILKI